jgi:cyclic pyranopterin phosphate synthase
VTAPGWVRDPAADAGWDQCRVLTCSVLPVRMACNLRCPFCFSKSSISSLDHDPDRLDAGAVRDYYARARDRGASRLVITGGGEPLLRPDAVVALVREGRRVFGEIACFTNGTYLTRELAARLADAGLSYVCWSRHAADDGANRALMGPGAPALADFVEAARPLAIRATCVMARGWVDDAAGARAYVRALRAHGIREFTFKHTYVAYPQSLFRDTRQDHWARDHKIDDDPFAGEGQVIATLPWGPMIRKIEEVQTCFYWEPTPRWELENRLCRSLNLLSDGRVYASLEDERSLLYRLPS